jgi:hypothetical protein
VGQVWSSAQTTSTTQVVPATPFPVHLFASGDASQPSFDALLKIPDGVKSASRYDIWTKFLTNARTEEIPRLASMRPHSFVTDLGRQTTHVGGLVFKDEHFLTDPDFAIKIDNEMLKELGGATASFEQFDLRALYCLRYLLQDLMNQLIFTFDPFFLGRYCEKYSEHKRLLVNMGYDGDLLKNAKKNPYIALTAEEGSFCINAVQYWKVVSIKKPQKVKGFDALRVQIFFDIRKIQPEKLLLSPNCTTVSLMFHGFRESLDAISY